MHSCSPIVQAAENSTKKPQNSCSQAHPQRQTTTQIPSGFCERFISICVSLSRDLSVAIITVRNYCCGKVMFSQASVCPERGGVCTRADTPPHIRRPLQGTVRILLECILVKLFLVAPFLEKGATYPLSIVSVCLCVGGCVCGQLTFNLKYCHQMAQVVN